MIMIIIMLSDVGASHNNNDIMLSNVGASLNDNDIMLSLCWGIS
jgi:hypothetical protein